MIRAVLGRCSQIWSPGSEVAIGRNSPRISAGARGFRSNMSWWLGPPSRLNRMTDLVLPAGSRAGPRGLRAKLAGGAGPAEGLKREAPRAPPRRPPTAGARRPQQAGRRHRAEQRQAADPQELAPGGAASDVRSLAEEPQH